jgi:hypothetical protein
MNTDRIPEIINILQRAASGDEAANGELKELAKSNATSQLIEICRNALANVIKNEGRSASRKSQTQSFPIFQPKPSFKNNLGNQKIGRFSNRCTVCDRPAIPGDSVCFTHNN